MDQTQLQIRKLTKANVRASPDGGLQCCQRIRTNSTAGRKISNRISKCYRWLTTCKTFHNHACLCLIAYLLSEGALESRFTMINQVDQEVPDLCYQAMQGIFRV